MNFETKTEENLGHVVKAGYSILRGRGFKSKLRCNPANGRVDIAEQLAYKTQIRGLEWNMTLSAETNFPQKNEIIFCTNAIFKSSSYTHLFKFKKSNKNIWKDLGNNCLGLISCLSIVFFFSSGPHYNLQIASKRFYRFDWRTDGTFGFICVELELRILSSISA